MRSAIAAFRSDFAGDSWTGRVADNAAGDQSNRTEDHGAREAAQSCVRDALTCVGGHRRKDDAGSNDNNSCKSFHRLGPSISPSLFQADLPGTSIASLLIRFLAHVYGENCGVSDGCFSCARSLKNKLGRIDSRVLGAAVWRLANVAFKILCRFSDGVANFAARLLLRGQT